MSKIEIIDNFLNKDDFEELKVFLMSRDIKKTFNSSKSSLFKKLSIISILLIKNYYFILSSLGKLQNNSEPSSVTLIASDASTPQSPNCITAII